MVNNYKIMKFAKNKFILFTFILFFILFFVPNLSLAQKAERETQYGLITTTNEGSLRTAFGSVGSDSGQALVNRLGGAVGALLSFIGLVFLGLMVYAGITWMTAAGNNQKADKAKKIMIWAVVGTICIFASFAVVKFIGEKATESINSSEEVVGDNGG